MIKSPFNYTGGKFQLLPKILELFPNKINTFVDLFSGGFNVGINITSNKIICNDILYHLIDFYKYLKENDINKVLEEIYEEIKKFKLEKGNRETYNNFRKYYNTEKKIIDFYILSCYAFNYNIRFNNENHEFNNSCGISNFNNSMKERLINFSKTLKEKDITFSSKSYKDFDYTKLKENDFVYCDPPYLISDAVYNEKRGFNSWKEEDDKNLYNILDELNERKIYFGLSNVFYHKNKSNNILIEWAKKYNVVYLDKNYNNCNYILKNRNAKTVEVYVTNFLRNKNTILDYI